ncbi:MAG TPA: hypothetical protein DCG47_07905 [Spirochaetaceae bacterium]|jgi:hypothetical protein|nr:hypothetical protein [Spirochaetaceae bacterium]
MKYLILVLLFTSSLFFNCATPPLVPAVKLNGVWEDASRDFSGEERIISTFVWGNAEIIRLHSFIFFITERVSVFITQNEAFYITKIEHLAHNKLKLSCYLEATDGSTIYTYVFKVIDDTTIEFLAKESSTPLFPAKLKKGGEVYP